MRRLLLLSTLVGCLFLAVPSWTQDAPEEKVRVLCDETDPEMGCPGPDCPCIPDSIEITFDGDSRSVLEYDSFTEGMVVDVVLVTDTQTPRVQGWSFGVSHDPRVLTLEGVSVKGTDADSDNFPGSTVFDATSMVDIQTCGPDPDCNVRNRTDGGGWITAIAYFTVAVNLPLRRNSLVRARYVLTQDVGEEGTLLQVTNHLAKENSPPTEMNVTVGGRSRLWTTAIDGWIKKRPSTAPSFIRGDANADDKVDISDPIFTLMYLFEADSESPSCLQAADADDDGDIDVADAIYGLDFQWFGGALIPEPYPACGSDSTEDELTCDSFPVCQ